MADTAELVLKLVDEGTPANKPVSPTPPPSLQNSPVESRPEVRAQREADAREQSQEVKPDYKAEITIESPVLNIASVEIPERAIHKPSPSTAMSFETDEAQTKLKASAKDAQLDFGKVMAGADQWYGESTTIKPQEKERDYFPKTPTPQAPPVVNVPAPNVSFNVPVDRANVTNVYGNAAEIDAAIERQTKRANWLHEKDPNVPSAEASPEIKALREWRSGLQALEDTKKYRGMEVVAETLKGKLPGYQERYGGLLHADAGKEEDIGFHGKDAEKFWKSMDRPEKPVEAKEESKVEAEQPQPVKSLSRDEVRAHFAMMRGANPPRPVMPERPAATTIDPSLYDDQGRYKDTALATWLPGSYETFMRGHAEADAKKAAKGITVGGADPIELPQPPVRQAVPVRAPMSVPMAEYAPAMANQGVTNDSAIPMAAFAPASGGPVGAVQRNVSGGVPGGPGNSSVGVERGGGPWALESTQLRVLESLQRIGPVHIATAATRGTGGQAAPAGQPVEAEAGWLDPGVAGPASQPGRQPSRPGTAKRQPKQTLEEYEQMVADAKEAMADRERAARYQEVRRQVDPVFNKEMTEYEEKKKIAEQNRIEQEAKRREQEAQRLQQEAQRQQQEEANGVSQMMQLGGIAMGGRAGRWMNVAGMAVRTFPQMASKISGMFGGGSAAGAGAATGTEAAAAGATVATTAGAGAAGAGASGVAGAAGGATAGAGAAGAAGGTAAAGAGAAGAAGAGLAAAAGPVGVALAIAGAIKEEINEFGAKQAERVQAGFGVAKDVISQDPDRMLNRMASGFDAVADKATEVNAVFGLMTPAAKAFVHGIIDMREVIQSTSENLGQYHGGLAGTLAQQDVQVMMRDINRANKFGDDFQRLTEQRMAIDHKIGIFIDRMTPLITKFASGVMTLLEINIEILNSGTKATVEVLRGLAEVANMVAQFIPGAAQISNEIRDMLRRMAQDGEQDDGFLAMDHLNQLAARLAQLGAPNGPAAFQPVNNAPIP